MWHRCATERTLPSPAVAVPAAGVRLVVVVNDDQTIEFITIRMGTMMPAHSLASSCLFVSLMRTHGRACSFALSLLSVASVCHGKDSPFSCSGRLLQEFVWSSLSTMTRRFRYLGRESKSTRDSLPSSVSGILAKSLEVRSSLRTTT